VESSCEARTAAPSAAHLPSSVVRRIQQPRPLPLFLRWSPTRERQRQPPWPRPPPRSPQPMNSLHSYASTSVFSAPAHSRASRASLRQPPASPVAARGDCRRRPTPVVPPGSASILLTCRRSNRPSLDRRRPAGLCIAWTRHLSAPLQRPSSILPHADRATPNLSRNHTNSGHAPPFPGHASKGLWSEIYMVGDLGLERLVFSSRERNSCGRYTKPKLGAIKKNNNPNVF
jgi:hypothetical protein